MSSKNSFKSSTLKLRRSISTPSNIGHQLNNTPNEVSKSSQLRNMLYNVLYRQRMAKEQEEIDVIDNEIADLKKAYLEIKDQLKQVEQRLVNHGKAAMIRSDPAKAALLDSQNERLDAVLAKLDEFSATNKEDRDYKSSLLNLTLWARTVLNSALSGCTPEDAALFPSYTELLSCLSRFSNIIESLNKSLITLEQFNSLKEILTCITSIDNARQL